MTTIDATTTFYALTAPVKGYTLEDQVLDGETLHYWLRKHDRFQCTDDDLADWLDEQPGFYTSLEDACIALSDDNGYIHDHCRPETFTAAELLNRLRLDAMDCD